MPEKSESKEIINPKSIIITTSTFYPNWNPEKVNENSSTAVRGKLALETIREATEKGYQVVVVDGGSGNLFTSEAKGLGAIVFDQNENGMSPGRRQAFREAAKLSDAQVICWTEPEKISIVRDCLPGAIQQILSDEADIVIPKRDEASFLTYPNYQAMTEKRANGTWNKILKTHKLLSPQTEDFDVWFGPRFFKNDSKILSLFLARYNLVENNPEFYKNANPEDWAGATFLPIISALHAGYRVKSVTVSYTHPLEQTKLEQNNETFNEKRRHQFKSIISITSQYIKLIEKDPKSLIRGPLN